MIRKYAKLTDRRSIALLGWKFLSGIPKLNTKRTMMSKIHWQFPFP